MNAAPGAAIREDLEAKPLAVMVTDAERMNLLGLLLSSLLCRRLTEPAGRRHASALRGDVLIEASGMQVTLRFAPGSIEIRRDASADPRAAIRGTLTALLGAALGRDRARSVITGQLRARGNPIALWHVLSLVRA